jgi:hypothetical protein
MRVADETDGGVHSGPMKDGGPTPTCMCSTLDMHTRTLSRRAAGAALISSAKFSTLGPWRCPQVSAETPGSGGVSSCATARRDADRAGGLGGGREGWVVGRRAGGRNGERAGGRAGGWVVWVVGTQAATKGDRGDG